MQQEYYDTLHIKTVGENNISFQKPLGKKELRSILQIISEVKKVIRIYRELTTIHYKRDAKFFAERVNGINDIRISRIEY